MNSRRSAPIDRGAAGAPVRAAGVVDANAVVAWLRAFAADVAARRDELTELDAAIGDADHGVNMDRGMQAVAAKLPAPEDPAPAGAEPARAALQDRRHDARLHGGRRGGTAVRHAVPRDGQGGRRSARR